MLRYDAFPEAEVTALKDLKYKIAFLRLNRRKRPEAPLFRNFRKCCNPGNLCVVRLGKPFVTKKTFYMHELIPIVVFTGFFAMVFGIVYLRTRENLAMLEKGLNPKQFANRPAPYKSLKLGLLLLGGGLGLLIAFLIDRNISARDENMPPIYFALIAIGGGLGLIASYAVEKKELLSKGDL
jgi:hypothetical protein